MGVSQRMLGYHSGTLSLYILQTRLKLAQDQLRSGNKSIVVVESRSISLVDKTTQTSDGDTAVVGTCTVCVTERDSTVCHLYTYISVGLYPQASGDDLKGSDVCPVMLKESSTDIMRSLSADRKVSSMDNDQHMHIYCMSDWHILWLLS